MGVNPDQRMHEDARHLCELTARSRHRSPAGFGAARHLHRHPLGALAGIRAHDRAGTTSRCPGYMVWAAILYAGFGSLLSYWVGGSLIGRNAERYAREADLRFALVRVNEHLDGITLAAGEEGERRRLETQPRWRAARHQAAGGGSHQPHLDHGRLRLGDDRGADPRRGAALLRRQALLRRHDDGRGRLHPGAVVAAVVRRQLQPDRRLARDAAAGSPTSAAPS